ncbi:MAG: FAD-dependent oxidoreductase [Cyanobacteriota bacterium]|nr:FAD-dependent oxidoreductase [Cyanobacteriota bacterium]
MNRIVIIGCGIIGATIAYELSQISGLNITVLDRQPPARESTGAALGVLMGAISQKKVKSRAWKLRRASMQRYETLIPELEARTGRTIPFNRNGILKLCFADEQTDRTLEKWQKLVEVRAQEGLKLNILSPESVRDRFDYLNCNNLIAAVESPVDRQVDPVALTQTLVEAAKAAGVTFDFDAIVTGASRAETADERVCQQIHYHRASNPEIQQSISTDWVVVAAGLGSTPFIESLGANGQPVDIQPVLGQALRLRLPEPLAQREPVITGNDIHIVPLGNAEYWLGATVEFPDESGEVVAESERLDAVLAGTIEFCPSLANAQILQKWSGLRPRPQGRPAPIIGKLPGYGNVLLATGHYRNGVLLAPATALEIRQAIEY